MRASTCPTALKVILGTFLVLTLIPALAALAAGPSDTFVFTSKTGALFWEPQVEFDSVVLTLSGPGDFQLRKVFNSGEIPSLSLFDSEGNALADGVYSYELRAVPILSATQKAAIRQVRETDDGNLRAQVARELPQGAVQAGYFTVMDQEFVSTDLGEAHKLAPRRLSADGPTGTGGQAMGAAASGDSELIPMAGQVVLTNADGVIRNSLCVGFDCPDSPVFSDSTILLMENNTRIKFGDTSNAPFPNNDWEIEANSSLSGGQGYLGFNDCGTADNDGGCATDLVFAVEAGARQNALYVESDGDIGIGTSNPVVDVHVVTGNTPTLRLDQDGSSGFTPQVWDVAGNETNFFVRDVTSGSTLPFRIRPGAPSSSIFIDTDGDVGLGTASPANPLHVLDSDSATGSKDLLRLERSAASTGVSFSLINGADTRWDFDNTQGGLLNISLSGSGGAEVQLTTRDLSGATNTMTVQGDIAAVDFNPTSSRELKTDIVALDGKAILQRLMQLPIAEWRFKSDVSGLERHLGPMAEDFREVFGLGGDGKHLSLVDTNGVALASIQGLNQELEELRQQVAELKALIRTLVEHEEK